MTAFPVGIGVDNQPIIADLYALVCLADAAEEMDRRYDALLQEGFTKLSDRFASGKKDIPFRVLVFDEFADLVHSGKEGKKEFERLVVRIAGKGERRASILLSRLNVLIARL